MTRRADGWWTRAFRRPYLEIYAHRDEASAEREVEFVASLLGLTPCARLLDAGCGAGRHARAFARRGAAAVGVDLSADLLVEAKRAAGVAYVLADVRRLPFVDGAFAHVVSLFTSFGYFGDAGDGAHAAELRRVLAPRGTFVVDFLNATNVEATLVAESERTMDGRVVRERRRIREGRVEKDVEMLDAAGAQIDAWSESVRLYRRAELESLLAAAGFMVTSIHGDLAGGAWHERAPRLVIGAVAA